VCYARRGAEGVENAAAGASARASSDVDGIYEARHAVDNDVKTHLLTNEERSPWWAVDLVQNYRINIVTVIVPVVAPASLCTPNY